MAESDTAKMERINVYVSEGLVERIEDQLEYADSRSQWIRQACRERLMNNDDGPGKD
jgi:hypothetical protein